MKRTTLRLDDDTLKRAKKTAAEAGMSFTTLVKEALVAYMARPSEKHGGGVGLRELPSYGVGGTLPGIDLDDMSALLDVMEADSRDSH